LIATWSQNIAYLDSGGPLPLFTSFWQDTRANPASRSITADITLLLLAAVVFMVIEARRHSIRFVWAYVVGAFLIAISVTFPLFLIARELKLAPSDLPRLSLLDKALLAVLAVLSTVFVLWVVLA
jgi:fumarate reductase subunit D